MQNHKSLKKIIIVAEIFKNSHLELTGLINKKSISYICLKQKILIIFSCSTTNRNCNKYL